MAISPQEVDIIAWRRAHAHIPFIRDLEKSIDQKVEVHPDLGDAEIAVSVCWPWSHEQAVFEAIAVLYRLKGWKAANVQPCNDKCYFRVTLIR